MKVSAFSIAVLLLPSFARALCEDKPAGRRTQENCRCVSPVQRGMIPLNGNNTIRYTWNDIDIWQLPNDYGSFCNQWDMPSGMLGQDVWGCGGATSGSCLDTWCYVDPCDCPGVMDETQTGMFATLYENATRLAYSYDKCAGCNFRTTETDCMGHTRCTWDSATASCQSGTDHQWAAVACDDVNLGSDIQATCDGMLSCKMENGRCTVRNQAEQRAAWQCVNDDTCRCIDPVARGLVPLTNQSTIRYTWNNIDIWQLPREYGSRCNTWDMPSGMAGQDVWGCGGVTSGSCLDTWCYVDPCNCPGVADETQTGMFATLYSTATRLAYSYDKCADCQSRTTEIDCGGHTRCNWDSATQTCQTGTDHQWIAVGCEDINNGANVQATCDGLLSCKMENGRCTVKTPQERMAAWQCPPESGAGVGETAMCEVVNGAEQCSTIQNQQCFSEAPDSDIMALQNELQGYFRLRPKVAYRDRATARLATQVFRIMATELMGVSIQLKDLGDRSDDLAFSFPGDLVPSGANPYSVDVDLEQQADRSAYDREYAIFVVDLHSWADLGDLGYTISPKVIVANVSAADMADLQTWVQHAALPTADPTLLATFPAQGASASNRAGTPYQSPWCVNNITGTCRELWSRLVTSQELQALESCIAQENLPYTLVNVTTNLATMKAGLPTGTSAMIYAIRSPSLEQAAVGGTNVALKENCLLAGKPTWKAVSSRLTSLVPVVSNAIGRMRLSTAAMESMLADMASNGATEDQGRPASSSLEFDTACRWAQNNLATIKSWLPICSSTERLQDGVCVLDCPAGQAPDPINPTVRCVSYADTAQTCNAGEGLAVPGQCIVATTSGGNNLTCADVAICIDANGQYVNCPPGAEDNRYVAIHEGWQIPAGDGGAICGRCPRGTFTASIGTQLCVPAPAGYFVPAVGSADAEPCGAGTFTPEAGYHVCLPCPEGQFQDNPGQTTCKPCTDYVALTTTTYELSVKPRGADANRFCGCPGGYRWQSGELVRFGLHTYDVGSCNRCSTGLSCRGGRNEQGAISIAPGYYSKADNPLSIYECLNIAMCPGGPLTSGDGNCATGRTGLACMKCMADHYPDGNECKPCDGVHFIPFVIAILVLLLVVALLYRYANADVMKQHRTTLTAGLVLGQLARVVQTLGIFGNLAMEWDEPLKSILGIAGVFMFDLDMIKPQCVMQVDNPVPMFIVTLLALPILMAILACIMKVSKNGFDMDRYFNTVGFGALVVYISITITVTRPFRCVANPNDTSAMESNRAVLCFDSEEHGWLVTFGIIGFLAYPVSILATVAQVTVRYPALVVSGKGGTLLARYRFLFQSFTPACYYWGTCYLLRNLALSLAPVIFIGSPVWQVVSIAVIFLVSLVITCILFPWRTGIANVSEIGAMVALIFFMLMGAFFIEPSESLTSVFTVLLAIVTIALLLILIGLVAYSMQRRFKSDKQYRVFLCHHKVGAGVLCRWIKGIYETQGIFNVFLDSDCLEELDLIVEAVRANTEYLVIVCSKMVLTRIWCSAEIATGFTQGVPVVPLKLGDFVDPDEEFLAQLDDMWTDQQVYDALGVVGMNIDTVKDSYRKFNAIDAIHLDRFSPITDQELCIQGLIDKSGGPATGMMTMKSTNSTKLSAKPDKGAQIIIAGPSGNPESRSCLEVIRSFVQMVVEVSVVAVHSVQEAEIHIPYVRHMVLVFQNGILEDQNFIGILLKFAETCKTEPVDLVTVLADNAFSFPGEAFYAKLEKDPAQKAAWQRCFNVLALPFTSHGSKELQTIQVSQVSRRFRSDRCGCKPDNEGVVARKLDGESGAPIPDQQVPSNKVEAELNPADAMSV